jgi:hypothetical protein
VSTDETFDNECDQDFECKTCTITFNFPARGAVVKQATSKWTAALLRLTRLRFAQVKAKKRNRKPLVAVPSWHRSRLRLAPVITGTA